MLIAVAFVCASPRVIDGDTLACGRNVPHVRLARIDAPELHGCPRNRHCAPGNGKASKAALIRIIDGRSITCHPVPASPRGGSVYDRWGRITARCSVNGVDLGSAMIEGGFAERWPHD